MKTTKLYYCEPCLPIGFDSGMPQVTYPTACTPGVLFITIRLITSNMSNTANLQAALITNSRSTKGPQIFNYYVYMECIVLHVAQRPITYLWYPNCIINYLQTKQGLQGRILSNLLTSSLGPACQCARML